MKLRNKKTGEIIDLEQWRLEYYRDSGCITITNDRNQNEQYCYETFAGMKEDWSDCMNLEPLIENRKIRKAVRAWAEANDYGDDEEYQFEDFHTGWHSWSLEHHQNGDDNEIHFNGGIDFKRVTHQSYYTIDELCGEEEK